MFELFKSSWFGAGFVLADCMFSEHSHPRSHSYQLDVEFKAAKASPSIAAVSLTTWGNPMAAVLRVWAKLESFFCLLGTSRWTPWLGSLLAHSTCRYGESFQLLGYWSNANGQGRSKNLEVYAPTSSQWKVWMFKDENPLKDRVSLHLSDLLSPFTCTITCCDKL